MTAKTCTKCDTAKPLSEFYAKKGGAHGRAATCKDCHKEAARDRYAANPELDRQRNRSWHQANRPRNAARAAAWRAANPEAWAMIKMRENHTRRARKLGATVGEVDLAAVLASGTHCYLCGDELAGPVQADHVVPLARGGAHCMANLLPVHATCNMRKSDRLLSELDWYGGPADIGVAVAAS